MAVGGRQLQPIDPFQLFDHTECLLREGRAALERVQPDAGSSLYDLDGRRLELGAGATMAGEHLAWQLRHRVLRGAVQHRVDALA